MSQSTTVSPKQEPKPAVNAANKLKYKRVLLKISGEALMGDAPFGIKPEVVETIAVEIAQAVSLGVELAIVVGGGNIFRGVQNSAKLGMDRAAADYVGMLATIMNSLVLQGLLKKHGLDIRVMSAIDIDRVAEPYIRLRAIRHLEKGRLVIFGAGTGNPFFSTDTTAALRAAEISADVILMAKNKVDGVYDKDPNQYDDAQKYDTLSYEEVMHRELKVMDLTAVSLCKETGMPIVVFDFAQKGAIANILQGNSQGTTIRRAQ
ncbi:MAG: UMP kinase [Cyanobacteria bacterium HKST-UBA06]|nr:UMP kinase [Cyanobacteria bacterium HKST-UBA04]MCA9807026.1 UMP kinase [Cyanobacteria bacterium HKST-UBA06]MCA9842381.1 UMP kinase [Cyanobacteria bacterium HKST-UBA03]